MAMLPMTSSTRLGGSAPKVDERKYCVNWPKPSYRGAEKPSQM